MITIDHSDIKANNQKRVLGILKEKRKLTKLEISRTLNISIPTVTSIIAELKKNSIVKKAGTATSTGGRKPEIIEFLPDSRYSIGIDLSKKYIRITLTNLDCKLIIDKKIDILLNSENIIPTIKTLIEDIINSKIEYKNNLMGIGLSIPGIVDEKNLKLKLATNFNLKNISFKSLKSYFKVPIYLENEANAAALAESKLGVVKNLKNLIYISITEGIGGGIFINNDMYKGMQNKAGEIGHMSIIKNGRKCTCGREGCWETYASNYALLNDYNTKSKNNISSLSTLINKFKSNDPIAVKSIENYIEYLAEGIQNLVFIFNPEYIVIGGEISKYPEIFEKKLLLNLFSNNEFYKQNDISILFSSLGSNSNILGASLIPILNTYNFYNK
jgi:predicted NBD/HSP70 family sugar kinase